MYILHNLHQEENMKLLWNFDPKRKILLVQTNVTVCIGDLPFNTIKHYIVIKQSPNEWVGGTPVVWQEDAGLSPQGLHLPGE